MLHIVICNNQPAEREAVQRAVEDYFQRLDDHTGIFSKFDNTMDLMDYLENGGLCDIVLLDICLPDVDGIAAAQQLRRREDSSQIIFLTASRDFAVEAFALNAAHYILKPFTQEQMNEAMSRAVGALRLDGGQEKIVLKGERGVLQVVEARTILYVENYRHHRAVFTTHGELKETGRTLSELATELERIHPDLFMRPYRGYVVNREVIQTVSSDGILLQNGDVIPVKAGDFRKLCQSQVDWVSRTSKRGE